MNRNLIGVVVAVTMLLPSTVFAVDETTGKVGLIHVGKAFVYLKIDGVADLCPSAESPAPSHPEIAITNGHTDAAMARLLSLLTAAKLAGKDVTIYTEGGSSWACYLVEARLK